MADSISKSILYHYTSAQALQRIVSTMELRASLASIKPRDVRYGEGQYLCDVLPGTMSDAQISRLLLGNPFEGKRFTHYIAVDVAGLTVLQGRPHIFVIPNSESLDLRGRIESMGRNTDDLPEGTLAAQIRG